jgi:hypothetical protein
MGWRIPMTKGRDVFYTIIFAVLAVLVIIYVVAQRARKG